MSPKQGSNKGLADVFIALRNEYTAEEPPARIEAFLRVQMHARARVRRIRILSAMAAVAASILLALFSITRYRAPAPISVPAVAEVRHDVPVPNLQEIAPSAPAQPMRLTGSPARKHHRQPPQSNWTDASEFVAVPYAEALAPSEQVDIYRVEVPRATLTHYGLPMRPDSIDSPVTADVAVGSDGVVRAIRFVH